MARTRAAKGVAGTKFKFKVPRIDTAKLTTAFISSSQSSFAAVVTLVYVVLAGVSGAGTWFVIENAIRGSFQVYAINCMAAGNCGMVSWWFAIAASVAYTLDLCLILLARQMGVPVQDRYLAAMSMVGEPDDGGAQVSPGVVVTGPARASSVPVGEPVEVMPGNGVAPDGMAEAFGSP